MKCPVDLPSGVEWAPVREGPKPKRPPPVDSEVEFVIDRFMSHARDERDKEWLIRVRWAGFSADDDTWEPAGGLPEELVRKYERRKKLPPGLLTQSGRPVIEPWIHEETHALMNSGLRA